MMVLLGLGVVGLTGLIGCPGLIGLMRPGMIGCWMKEAVAALVG